MKLLFVTLLLALSLTGLIIGIDIIMGTPFSLSLLKTINPYKVLDPGELAITLFLGLYVAINFYRSYRKRRKAKPQTQS